LDTISYDAEGKVRLGGRTVVGSLVRIYLNNTLIAESDARDDGSWATGAAEQIAPGVYTLRADQIGADGTVLAQVTTPFLREAVSDNLLAEGSMTVQRGDNLWRIAQNRYGSGTQYTVIFGANRDAIRDPDLIYPGQVFILPDSN
jgi:nucleoid-associated protein YgaU